MPGHSWHEPSRLEIGRRAIGQATAASRSGRTGSCFTGVNGDDPVMALQLKQRDRRGPAALA
jgi:hypothetical protein